MAFARLRSGDWAPPRLARRLSSLRSVRLLLALQAAARASAQGNPCPLNENSTAQRSCGASLCFAGNFGDFGVLQRAPAIAAYYGATGVPPVAGAAIALTLAGTLDDGSAYNKTFTTTSAADGTWKVLLDPMPTYGSFTATVASGGASVTLRNQTFGLVWVFSGQSNQGSGSPVRNNFFRNESYEGVANGSYANIVFCATGDSGGVAWPREELGNWVADQFTPLLPFTPDRVKFGDLDGYAATPIFTAMRLTSLFRERGERPPPLGIYVNAVGGTDLAA